MVLDTQTRMTRARIQLCLRKPYLSSALMRFPLQQADGIVSTLATDGYRIYWNESFVKTLSDAELRGVLAHELMHILTQSVGRRQSRDQDLWNMATDYAINLVLVDFGFTIPKDGLVCKDYEGMSAEQIYELLAKKAKRSKGRQIASGGASGSDAADAGVVPDVGHDLVDPNSHEASRLRALSDGPVPDAQEVAEAASAGLHETMQALKATGSVPGSFQAIAAASQSSLIDWRTLLADWMYDRVRDDWSAWPPSKKHIARGLYLPSVGAPAPIRLVMFVDTSGSMSDASLKRIFGEIRSFRETFPTPFSIVQADVGVRRVDEYDAYEDFDFEKIRISGRGGTEFVSGYKWIDERFDAEPVAVIHATDGWGNFPKFCPHPVVFLVPREAAAFDSSLSHFPNWGRRIVI